MNDFAIQTPSKADATAAKVTATEYDVAEVRDDGSVVLEMGDGRMFVAQGKEGTKPNKRSKVTIAFTDTDKSDVPIDAKVQSVS